MVQENRESFMMYSKFFFDRCSGEGFLRGIPVALSDNFNTGGITWHENGNHKPTGFILPAPFRNGEIHAVSIQRLNHGKTLILKPWFHIALCLCGLGIVSIGIIIFCFPVDVGPRDQGSNPGSSKLKIKIQRVFIPN